MELRSLQQRLRNKFNVSVAEIGAQDIHQTLEIGLVFIAPNTAQADSTADHMLDFVESNTEAELIGVERRLL